MAALMQVVVLEIDLHSKLVRQQSWLVNECIVYGFTVQKLLDKTSRYKDRFPQKSVAFKEEAGAMLLLQSDR